MIYHTAADDFYCEKFLDVWHASAKLMNPSWRTSVYHIGTWTNFSNVPDIYTHERIKLRDIASKYKCDTANAISYYSLARFATMPDDDDIMLCGLDTVCINPMNMKQIAHHLKRKPMLRCLTQPGASAGIYVLRKDIVSDVRQFATELLANEPTIEWATTEQKIYDFMLQSFAHESWEDIYRVRDADAPIDPVKFANRHFITLHAPIDITNGSNPRNSLQKAHFLHKIYQNITKNQ